MSLAVSIVSAGCILAMMAFAAPRPPVVRFVGTDYAFMDVPPTVRHGLTYFAFKNSGTVRHEMSLIRLKAGVTPDAMIEKFKSSAKGRGKDFEGVGLLVEPPGEQTIGWLAMELRRGETYMIVCTLRDKPDAAQHFDLGMYAAFTVR